MLRVALIVSWEDHLRNFDLYDNLPRLSDKIRHRRMRPTGHCVQHPELTISELIICECSHGTRTRGGPHATFLGTLKRDTGLNSASEIQTLMEDRNEWRAAIRDYRVGVGWRPHIVSHILYKWSMIYIIENVHQSIVDLSFSNTGDQHFYVLNAIVIWFIVSSLGAPFIDWY